MKLWDYSEEIIFAVMRKEEVLWKGKGVTKSLTCSGRMSSSKQGDLQRDDVPVMMPTGMQEHDLSTQARIVGKSGPGINQYTCINQYINQYSMDSRPLSPSIATYSGLTIYFDIEGHGSKPTA